jgi:fatty acyl-CoA reductase
MMQVVGKELFGLLREKHGDGFDSFIEEKIVPLAGDVMREGFGVDRETLRELRVAEELNVIVNGAATTNFYERYDVALDVNVAGVRHMCDFARRCPNLEVLLHVSTGMPVHHHYDFVKQPYKLQEKYLDGFGIT